MTDTRVPTGQLPAAEVLAEAAADMRQFSHLQDDRLTFLPAVAELLGVATRYVQLVPTGPSTLLTEAAVTVARTWLSERLRLNGETAPSAVPAGTVPAETAPPVHPATTEPQRPVQPSGGPGTNTGHGHDWERPDPPATPQLSQLEVDRLTRHSITLNRLGWRMAEALGQVPDGADQVAGNPEEQLTALLTALEEARRERAKLAATIAAYLGTDERAVHDAANLAHARDQRDDAHRQLAAARAAVERVRALAKVWASREPYHTIEFRDAVDAIRETLDASAAEERSDEGPKTDDWPRDEWGCRIWGPNWATGIRAQVLDEIEAHIRREVVAGRVVPWLAGEQPTARAVSDWVVGLVRAAAQPAGEGT